MVAAAVVVAAAEVVVVVILVAEIMVGGGLFKQVVVSETRGGPAIYREGLDMVYCHLCEASSSPTEWWNGNIVTEPTRSHDVGILNPSLHCVYPSAHQILD